MRWRLRAEAQGEGGHFRTRGPLSAGVSSFGTEHFLFLCHAPAAVAERARERQRHILAVNAIICTR